MHNFAGCDGHICAVERLRQEDHEFETSRGYIISSRPAWVTKRDPALKTKVNKDK
jgi:hypothetical protein